MVILYVCGRMRPWLWDGECARHVTSGKVKSFAGSLVR